MQKETHTFTPNAYSAPAKIFHWLIVLLLIVQYTIGWLMPDVGRDTQPIGLISWHLSIGSLIVLVVVARLLWRWTHPAPAALKTTSLFLQQIAHFTHVILYALLIAFPLMGWANASSRGWPVSLFGVVPLPPLSPKGSSVGHLLGDAHQLTVWILLALVGLHIVAALYHHLIVKDDTLKRMLP
ncbi:cytochrome b [Glaciimonas immobilis]|uniref:Cytochrome b561 n=1 Tax=Glaciimonas immobilis TaxID=728004 RepID=A0A840RUU6_9BURK|nr:cytochrome b [Glaciimonas immobilis]KAF3997477.1 cytochrome b [Glaciimonas immobilis]MBB5200848.1 cytochrome b561 [Glaciimonas immobilis]